MNIKNNIMSHYTAEAHFSTGVGSGLTSIYENLDSMYEVHDFMNRMVEQNPYFIQFSEVKENGDWSSYTYVLLQNEKRIRWKLVGIMSNK